MTVWPPTDLELAVWPLWITLPKLTEPLLEMLSILILKMLFTGVTGITWPTQSCNYRSLYAGQRKMTLAVEDLKGTDRLLVIITEKK